MQEKRSTCLFDRSLDALRAPVAQMSFILVGCTGSFISLLLEFSLMVEPYTLFADVAAMLAVGAVVWILLLFISRRMAWLCSAVVSLLFLLPLLVQVLATLPVASPAARWDMLSATGLCLVVHLISDFALVAVSRRIVRIPIETSVITMHSGGDSTPHPFCPEPVGSLGD